MSKTVYGVRINMLGFPMVCLCIKENTEMLPIELAKHWFDKGRFDGTHYACILVVMNKNNECLAFSARELI